MSSLLEDFIKNHKEDVIGSTTPVQTSGLDNFKKRFQDDGVLPPNNSSLENGLKKSFNIFDEPLPAPDMTKYSDIPESAAKMGVNLGTAPARIAKDVAWDIPSETVKLAQESGGTYFNPFNPDNVLQKSSEALGHMIYDPLKGLGEYVAGGASKAFNKLSGSQDVHISPEAEKSFKDVNDIGLQENIRRALEATHQFLVQHPEQAIPMAEGFRYGMNKIPKVKPGETPPGPPGPDGGGPSGPSGPGGPPSKPPGPDLISRTAQPIIKGAKGLAKGVDEGIYAIKDELADSIIKNSSEGVDAYIRKQYEKGVRPPVTSGRTAPQYRRYMGKALGAVDTITKNKPILRITDEYGEPTEKLPETLMEFGDAISQSKEILFREYDAKQIRAGEAGAKVQLSPIVKELRDIEDDPSIQDLYPEVVKYAKNRADALELRESYDTGIAQDAIKNLNNTLKSFYKNPSYGDSSKAAVDGLIANLLRRGLDNVIEETDGPGYQDLKNRYGELVSIEKDVLHRAVVDARKNNKSLIDFSDIFTGAEVISGIVNVNPSAIARGVFGKIMASYIKRLNDPNRAIKNLFEAAEKRRKEEPEGLSHEAPSEAPPEEPPKGGLPAEVTPVGKTPTGSGAEAISEEPVSSIKKTPSEMRDEIIELKNPPKKEEGVIPKTTPTSPTPPTPSVVPDKLYRGQIDKEGQTKMPEPFKEIFPKSLFATSDSTYAKQYGENVSEISTRGHKFLDMNNPQNDFERDISSRIQKFSKNKKTMSLFEGQKIANELELNDYAGITKLNKDNISEYIYTKGIPGQAKPFGGFTDLSTKLIEDLKGRTTISRTYIENRMNSSDINLNKIQKDLVKKVLDSSTFKPYYQTKSDTGGIYISSSKPTEGNLAEYYINPEARILDTKGDTLPITAEAEKSELFNDAKRRHYEGVSFEEYGPDGKKVESTVVFHKKDLLPKKEGQINVQVFADAMQAELLPLGKRIFSSKNTSYRDRPTHSGTALPSELRGNVEEYEEIVFTTPFKTASGSRHYSGVDNYFGHNRVDTLEGGKIQNVLEIQNDMHQKGNFEDELERDRRELSSLEYNARISEVPANKDIYENYKKWQEIETNKRIFNPGTRRYRTPYPNALQEKARGILDVLHREMMENYRLTSDYQKTVERQLSNRAKLLQYGNPSGHFRQFREQLKLAATRGVEKLRVPTGDTIFEIEGFSRRRGGGRWTVPIDKENQYSEGRIATQNDLKVGEQLHNQSTRFIVTSVREDGSFDAVRRRYTEKLEDINRYGYPLSEYKKAGDYYYKPVDAEPYNLAGKSAIDGIIPTRDNIKTIIAGLDSKIEKAKREHDTAMHDKLIRERIYAIVYRFYARDLGDYLIKNWGAKLMKDDKGVDWFEVPVKEEYKKMPVEALNKPTKETMIA